MTPPSSDSFSAPAPQLSVVVAAYNAAPLIAGTTQQILDFFDEHRIAGEVVVVDDGSRDETFAAIPKNERVVALRLPVNQGKGAALREGMMKARGNVRAFTDADLPYGVEPLATAMAYIMQRGFHAVLGDRTQAASNTAPASFARRCLSSLASICFRTMLTGGIYDTQCGFKSFRGDVAAEVFSLATVNRFAIDIEVIYMMLKYQLDIKRIPVRLRKSDSSTVKMFQDSFQAFKDIIKVRWNWSRGVYRSEILKQLPEADLSDLTKSFLAQTSGGRQRDTYERL